MILYNVQSNRKFVYAVLKNFNSNGIIEYLEENNYFEAPAAKSHHGNYRGGLADHSVCVATQLMKMTDKLELEWQRKESPAIVGLLHDICKMDDYLFVTDTIQGKSYERIEINRNKILNGHGDKSCIMALTHMNLTDEEIMCIRYHMGAFEKSCSEEAASAYSRAVRRYSNVLYTHTADMIASQILNV